MCAHCAMTTHDKNYLNTIEYFNIKIRDNKNDKSDECVNTHKMN